MPRGFRNIALIAVLLVAFATPLAAQPKTAFTVVVVDELPQALSREIRRGIAEGLSPSKAGKSHIKLRHFASHGDRAAMKRRIAKVLAAGNDVDLIVCLGTRSSRIAIAAPGRKIPVVCLAVRGGIESLRPRRAAPANGVYFDYAPEQIFDALRRVLPRSRKIGVVCSSDFNCACRREADMARIRRKGFDLVVRRVRKRREIARVVVHLLQRSDVLWLQPDPLVLERETTRYLLGKAVEMGRPVIGLSRTFVKAGALFCLEHDPKDLGRQLAGLMVGHLRKGKGSMTFVPPRKAILVVNEKMARLLGVTLSPALLASPDVRLLK